MLRVAKDKNAQSGNFFTQESLEMFSVIKFKINFDKNSFNIKEKTDVIE